MKNFHIVKKQIVKTDLKESNVLLSFNWILHFTFLIVTEKLWQCDIKQTFNNKRMNLMISKQIIFHSPYKRSKTQLWLSLIRTIDIFDSKVTMYNIVLIWNKTIKE